ncbi:MAG: prepilin-type N-terminal cleavage/methylation domain-containing protein [Candidatus Campbellbacteria bacterium]|nr:prepilin-type N-terminal cleavage/methylation domain-containing protein [Candidatus Campbellbacteria bacterium]
MKKFTRGFTLIELLVVIAIIGILSSVVLASLNSAREKSRDAKRVSDVKNVQLALELYFDSCGQYPDALLATANNGCPTGVAFGDYLSAMPADPLGGVYQYTGLDASCTSYHIGTVLEQTGHQVLSSDSDLELSIANEARADACVAVAAFDGVSIAAGCASDATATGATDLCYDVTP